MQPQALLLGPPSSSFRGQIGVAVCDITPQTGIFARNWGAATHDVATSIHRPLGLHAMSIRADGQLPLVLVDADLGFWTTLPTFERLRQRVLRALGIPVSNFLFALTHTHASPHLSDPQPEWPGGAILAEWLEELTVATIQVCQAAIAGEQQSLLEWHTGTCQLASARDLFEPGVAPSTNARRRICGYDPSGRPDQTLLVGRVTDKNGGIRASIVNYACHPTTLAWENTSISPDFIGAMREVVSRENNGAPTFFLQGASGELAPRWQYVGDPAVADRHGRQLGFATLATLEDMNPPGTQLCYDGVVESGAPLAVWRPRPVPASESLAARMDSALLPLKDWPTAEELDQEYQTCTDRALAERLRRKRNIRLVLGDDDQFELPIYVWMIGEAILVGSMTEAYSDFQTALRRHFPERHIVCLNVVNGCIGYLCPEERYDEEVYQAWQSPFDRKSLPLFIDRAIQLVSAMIDEHQKVPV